MTVTTVHPTTETRATAPSTADVDVPATGRPPYELPVVDLYRDIHKGIRAELFAIVSTAGSLDPADDAARIALHDHVASIAGVLESHAHHEDVVIDPVLEDHLPALASRIQDDHVRIEDWFGQIVDRSAAFVPVASADARRAAQELHLELASFTGEYLVHQDVEERVVMPALERAVGVDAVGAMLGAIVASIPPDEMMSSLSFMLPAMNVIDRIELLGGIGAGAPAPVFDEILGLARSVLGAAEVEPVLAGLGRR